MRIRFENRNAFNVIGYSIETDLSSNDKDIGLLWRECKEKLMIMPESLSNLYGIIWYTKNHRYNYLLGIEKNDRFQSIEQYSIIKVPAAYFAVASVPNRMTAAEAWTEYFEKELPARNYAPDDKHGIYFEFYNEFGNCELWTPVKKQAVSACAS